MVITEQQQWSCDTAHDPKVTCWSPWSESMRAILLIIEVDIMHNIIHHRTMSYRNSSMHTYTPVYLELIVLYVTTFWKCVAWLYSQDLIEAPTLIFGSCLRSCSNM